MSDKYPDTELCTAGDVTEEYEPNRIMQWCKAAAVRAVKTMAQAAVAAIPTTAATLGGVDWPVVAGTALLAGVVSLLTSVAGMPEVADGQSLAVLGNI